MGCRLPQFDRVSFRVMNSSESVDLGIPLLRSRLHIDAPAPQLRDHGVQVRDSEVDHPLLLGPAEIFRVVLERAEDGRSAALLPDGIRYVYTEMVRVPL